MKQARDTITESGGILDAAAIYCCWIARKQKKCLPNSPQLGSLYHSIISSNFIVPCNHHSLSFKIAPITQTFHILIITLPILYTLSSKKRDSIVLIWWILILFDHFDPPSSITDFQFMRFSSSKWTVLFSLLYHYFSFFLLFRYLFLPFTISFLNIFVALIVAPM